MKLPYTIAALAATALAADASTLFGIGNAGDNRANSIAGQSFVVSETGNTPVTGIPSGEFADLASLSSAASITLNTFSFRYANGTSGSGPAVGTLAYVQIYEAAGIDLTDLTTATADKLVGSSNNTNDMNVNVGNQNQVVTWNFTGLMLDADTQYMALLSTDTGAGNFVAGRLELTTDNSSYSEGQLVRSNGANSAWDTDFSLTATAEPVPEPSSTALLGLGSLALILRRRK